MAKFVVRIPMMYYQDFIVEAENEDKAKEEVMSGCAPELDAPVFDYMTTDSHDFGVRPATSEDEKKANEHLEKERG